MQDDSHRLLFSEFLASFLLVKREISYLELTNMMSDFSYEHPEVEFIEHPTDLDFLKDIVVFDGQSIYIDNKFNYKSLVFVNNKVQVLSHLLAAHSRKEVKDFLLKQYTDGNVRKKILNRNRIRL